MLLLLVLSACRPSTPAPDPVAQAPKVQFKLLPESIHLRGSEDEHGVLASGADGSDLTRSVRYFSSNPSIFVVASNGVCRPVSDGNAELLAVANSTTNKISVEVADAAVHRVPSFRQDIEPVLTRLECNMGACHGKQAGQNGFKLSLRGYAPEMDFPWLTTEIQGRRVIRAFPEESLLVLKPLGKVTHEGGVKFDENSRYYKSLVDWIAARTPAPVSPEQEPSVESLEILPGDRISRPGQKQQLLVRARWSDGRMKDVTWLTQFFSNNETVATVSPNGMVQIQRSGETSIRAHFQGIVSVIRFTAPYTNQVVDSSFAITQNQVDAPVLAKLKSLRIPPSGPADDRTFLRRAMLDTLGVLPTPEEIQEFTAETNPDKRKRLVDSLFNRPEFVDFWTLQMADLFQNRKERDHDVRENKNVRAFHTWLRGEVARNRPWNELAREIITAKGDSGTTPQIGYYIYLVGEKQAPESEVTDAVAQTFLGTRIGCARWHNHPLERFTQDDFYHFAAFFDRVSLDRKATTTLNIQSKDEMEKRKRFTEQEKRLQDAQSKLLQADESGLGDARKQFSDRQRELAQSKRELVAAQVRAPHTKPAAHSS